MLYHNIKRINCALYYIRSFKLSFKFGSVEMFSQFDVDLILSEIVNYINRQNYQLSVFSKIDFRH